MLIGFIDIENGRDKVGDLSGMIDVHHVQSHLFGKERVVFGHFFHFTQQRARERFHFKRIVLFVVEVIDCSRHRRRRVQRFSNAETLERRNEYVEPAVG